jgi:GxxExxY protein
MSNPKHPFDAVMHIDGGARGNPGPAACAVVVAAADGAPLASFSKYLGETTNNVAEYRGLLAALEYALEHHYLRLKVVSDSELLVRQMQGRYKVKSADLKPLHEQARRLIDRLAAFSIEHVRREANREADRLVNEALDVAERDRGHHQDTKTQSKALESKEGNATGQVLAEIGPPPEVGKEHAPIPNELNRISRSVVDAVYAVHSTLGPGLLEGVYEVCLAHELAKRKLSVERQVAVPIEYDGVKLDAALRIDMLVEKRLVVELKSVEALLPVHTAQVLTYLKLTGCRLGLLINFNVPLIRDGIKRVVL